MGESSGSRGDQFLVLSVGTRVDSRPVKDSYVPRASVDSSAARNFDGVEIYIYKNIFLKIIFKNLKLNWKFFYFYAFGV